MTQINSIKLGVIVMCVATVTLSPAQTPRIGTGGSNQTGSTNRAPAGHSGLSGNVTSAAQFGTNLPSSMSTGPNTNAGVHIGMNAGAQIGISNPTGITSGAAGGIGDLSGNSTGATQIGTNARTGTNTTASTNAGAHAAAAAATRASVNINQPQLIPVPIRAPCLTTAPSAQISRLRENPPRRYHRPRSPQLRLQLRPRRNCSDPSLAAKSTREDVRT